jgi:hypothetical protein
VDDPTVDPRFAKQTVEDTEPLTKKGWKRSSAPTARLADGSSSARIIFAGSSSARIIFA